MINVIHAAVGSITKTDVQHAQVHECPVYCFRVRRPLRHDQHLIDKHNIRALYYEHHEHLIDQIEKNMVSEYDKRKRRAERHTEAEEAKAAGR